MHDPFKRKQMKFSDLTREEKLGNAFYSHQSPYRKEAEESLRREGWKTPGPKLLGTYERGCVSPLDGRMKEGK